MKIFSEYMIELIFGVVYYALYRMFRDTCIQVGIQLSVFATEFGMYMRSIYFFDELVYKLVFKITKQRCGDVGD